MDNEALSSEIGILMYNTWQICKNQNLLATNLDLIGNGIGICEAIGYDNLDMGEIRASFINECIEYRIPKEEAESVFDRIINEYLQI